MQWKEDPIQLCCEGKPFFCLRQERLDLWAELGKLLIFPFSLVTVCCVFPCGWWCRAPVWSWAAWLSVKLEHLRFFYPHINPKARSGRTQHIIHHLALLICSCICLVLHVDACRHKGKNVEEGLVSETMRLLLPEMSRTESGFLAPGSQPSYGSMCCRCTSWRFY